MSGKHATLTQVKQVVALREMGATKAVIAEEVGISISTVSRLCKRFSTSKGKSRYALVLQVKERLVEALSNDDKYLDAAVMHLADDLASTRIIRNKIIEAVNNLTLDDPDQVTNSLRALNSATSALATAQKIGRIATGADEANKSDHKPTVLEIKTMSDDEVLTMREVQINGDIALREADTVVEPKTTC